MYDEKGRVWWTSRVGPPPNPDFCKKGSDHPSAKVFPLATSTRHLSMLDPKTGKITLIRTCFPTHHLVFAEDANNTLWLSAGGPGSGVLGWLDTKKFDETGDEAKSQGWTPIVIDTNGNGKRDEWVEPNQPVDPDQGQAHRRRALRHRRQPAGRHDLGLDPDVPGLHRPRRSGRRIRRRPRSPKSTSRRCRATARAASTSTATASPGCRCRAATWARFDRSKCKVLRGPETATGRHCPEGWTLYPFPGPQMQGVPETGSAEASYYTWVDQFDTFGLGRNVPWATGNANESLMALVDGQWLNFVVPYPLGFYAKWMDGRIDDPNAGWKGKGVWATYGTRTPFHLETGKGTRPKVVKFQLRPDPLAR